MAIEDDVIMRICPPKLHHNRLIIAGHILEGFVQTLGRRYILGWDKVVRYYTQVLVGDDEWDIVAIRDDALHQRVVDVVAHSIAIDSLHCRSPQLHIVFLLRVESLGHTVGHQQRNTNEYGGEYKDYDSAILEYLIFQTSQHSFTLLSQCILRGEDSLELHLIGQSLNSLV